MWGAEQIPCETATGKGPSRKKNEGVEQCDGVRVQGSWFGRECHEVRLVIQNEQKLCRAL